MVAVKGINVNESGVGPRTINLFALGLFDGAKRPNNEFWIATALGLRKFAVSEVHSRWEEFARLSTALLFGVMLLAGCEPEVPMTTP